jgi:hypothetical protein
MGLNAARYHVSHACPGVTTNIPGLPDILAYPSAIKERSDSCLPAMVLILYLIKASIMGRVCTPGR